MAFLNETGLAYFFGKLRGFFVAKKTFSSTAVFHVALSANTTATTDSPYTVTAQQMGGSFRDLFIKIYFPAATAAGALRVTVEYSDGTSKICQLSNALNTSKRYVGVRVMDDYGMAVVYAYQGTSLAQAAHYVAAGTGTFDPVFISGTATITNVKLAVTTSGVVFPASTDIKIYAAS